MSQCLVRAAVLASAALLVAAPARAQSLGGIALDRLEPAPAGDAFYGVPSPFIGGHLVPRAFVLVDHASDPLVLSTASSSRPVVSGQTMLHIDASLALWDRLRADVLVPLALAQAGEGAPAGATSSLTAPALGDVRLGARVRVAGEEGGLLQLALGAYVHLPVGASDAFVGEGAVRDTPYIAVGGRAPYLVWSASVGVAFSGSRSPTALTYGGGAAALLAGGRVQVGPEIFVATPLQDALFPVSETRSIQRERVTNAEALLSARLRLLAGFALGAGAGVGLSDAIGTPAFRVVGGLGWELPVAPPSARTTDTDADGLVDAEDACPYAFGAKGADPKRRGCPAEEAGVESAPAPAAGAGGSR